MIVFEFEVGFMFDYERGWWIGEKWFEFETRAWIEEDHSWRRTTTWIHGYEVDGIKVFVC
jgi:hypothetical protein